MEYSKSGLALTAQFEGCEHLAYKDIGGVLTIGYGHTGPDVHPGMTCSHEQAEEWLMQDIQKAANAVDTMVKVPLTQGQYDSLVDLTFNIGIGAFQKSTLLKLLNAGDYAGAAEQFERWSRVKGKVVAGLLRRRQAEKAVFLGTADATQKADV